MRVRPAGFFVVRSPLLSVDAELARAGETPREAALRLLADPIFEEALRHASPSLANAVRERGTGEEAERAAFAVLRYAERMRGRSTPFGVLAGYCVGRTNGTAARIELAPKEEHYRVVRLDVDVVREIVVRTRQAPDARRRGRFVRRLDLLVFPDMVRIAKRALDQSVTYTDVGRSRALDSVVEAATVPKTRHELAEAIRFAARSEEEALGYVDRLIDTELLVPEEYPPLLAENELDVLRNVPEAHPIVDLASSIRRTPLVHDVRDTLAKVEACITSLAGKNEETFVVDVEKSVVNAELDRPAMAEVERVIRALLRLSVPHSPPELEAFRTLFLERYELREVPLVEALDEERGYDFRASDPTTARRPPLRSAHLKLVLRLYDEAMRSGRWEAELLDADLEAFPETPPNQSTAITFSAASANGALEIHQPYFYHSPGTGLFARATAFLPSLRDEVRAHLADVASRIPDTDVADVAYLVVGRTGTFSQFPPLQPAELTLTPRSSTGTDARLDPNDLLLSVRGGRFVLRCRRTGRRVLLAPTGAANLSREDTTSLARFVQALAWQDLVGSTWSWGPLAEAPVLPRIRYRQHVLSAMQWRIDGAILEALRRAPAPERAAQLGKLREELRIPRRVLYEDFRDQRLPVDLESEVSVGAWLDVAKRGDVFLSEVFPVERSIVRGPDGPYAHEIVVPFMSLEPATQAPRGRLLVERDIALPGSNYLYVKLNGSRGDLLRLLTELAEDVIEPLARERAFEHWFYLPYVDTDAHLRIRFKGEPDVLLSRVLPNIQEWAAPQVALGVLRDFTVQPYERETARYGNRVAMDLVERVWARSSELALERHRQFDVFALEEVETIRELTNFQLVMLESAALEPSSRRDIAKAAFERYARTDPMPLRRAGASHHRTLKSDTVLAPSDAVLARLLAEIDARFREGAIPRSLDDLLPDLLHTHAFRLLTAWHSVDNAEALGYVVSEKVYASIVSRDRTSAQ